jgi:hypothetical protein
MINRTDLPNVDTSQNNQGLNDLFVQWLSTTVDVLNQDIDTIENALNNIIAIGVATVGGTGAGPYTVTVTGLTSTGYVQAMLLSSTNSVTIVSIVPGAGSFQITFSGDPGAGSLLKYSAYSAQP